eukprot:TRINITY_DN29814_c0_g1_i1.p1 TRINITY_DN29814_c0_g1~~TRINITY_DN29814_c0_g1_i1.p1  ORF type:complete len:232 (-),score=26.29 TRINITY_DN29814_c0_g1_i1:46-741(-)
MAKTLNTKPNSVAQHCNADHNMVVACWDATKDTPHKKKPYDKPNALSLVAPTVLWLVCPNIYKNVSRMETAGGVKHYTTKVEEDADLRQQYQDSHKTYERWLEQTLPADRWKAFQKYHIEPAARKYGNAGVTGPLIVKCLHANVAGYLGGAGNPIGEQVVKGMIKEHAQGLADRKHTDAEIDEMKLQDLLVNFDVCAIANQLHEAAVAKEKKERQQQEENKDKDKANQKGE